jgi:hypothetical protein
VPKRVLPKSLVFIEYDKTTAAPCTRVRCNDRVRRVRRVHRTRLGKVVRAEGYYPTGNVCLRAIVIAEMLRANEALHPRVPLLSCVRSTL